VQPSTDLLHRANEPTRVEIQRSTASRTTAPW
jgi:hypothetical protein